MRLAYLAFATISVLTVSTGFASVSSYFNQNQKTQYRDPYRGITRPGDDLEKVIVQKIRLAKKSVHVAVQEIRLPLIAQALIEKHKAGLDVRIIIENDYNHNSLQAKGRPDEHEATRSNDLFAFVDLNKNKKLEPSEMAQRDAIYMLQQAKVPLIDDTQGGTRGAALMHHKFVVIDDQTTIVTTANFTLSCVHGDFNNANSRGNPNSLMVVGSKAFADLFSEEFGEMWNNGRFGVRKTYRAPRSVTVAGTKLTVQFSPTSASLGWDASVNGLIAKTVRGATSSVKAALFVFSDQKLANALEEINNKGVDLGFIIETKFAYRDYSELLDMMGLQILSPAPTCKPTPANKPWKKPIKEGGMWGTVRGDILHHKFAVVDSKKVIMGSQNWTSAANSQNDETLLVVESAPISDAYSREYARIRSIAVMGAPDNIKTMISRRNSECSGMTVEE